MIRIAAFNGAFLNSIEGGYGSNNKQYTNVQTNYFEEDGTNLSFFAERSNKELYNKYDGNMSHNVGINGHKQINEQVTIAGSINYNNIKNRVQLRNYLKTDLIKQVNNDTLFDYRLERKLTEYDG